MIANALTKGKTILFVAEKMAALEVVQKRLASLGIGDFCLELHSNKATKKAVLDQLKHGLELDQIGERTEYQSKIEDIRKIRSELDAYAQALHKRRSFGKSVRELMDIYETIPEQNVMISFDHNDVKALTESELDYQKYALERLIAAAQYLQAENNLFDIVIFDEASQLPTCKAVGVLAKAKNAVIVGDPNQMPPTSFFAGITEAVMKV